jgi:hypothetical protein
LTIFRQNLVLFTEICHPRLLTTVLHVTGTPPGLELKTTDDGLEGPKRHKWRSGNIESKLLKFPLKHHGANGIDNRDIELSCL